MSLLFRRRTVWLPSAGLTLALLVLLTAAAFGLGRGLGDWLAVSEPASGGDGRGARTLVVEGWLDPDALRAVIAFHRTGAYEQVIVSGGPIEERGWSPRWATYAERGAEFLRENGLAAADVSAVPAPASAQDRTFLSAVVVRDWAAARGLRLASIDLATAGVHARRSRQVWRLALGPAAEVGVVALRGRDDDPAHWWRTSRDAKATIGELLAVAWTACCFRPPPPGSHEERWAVPAARP